MATTDIGEALAGCGIVIVATTADVHGAVAQLAATHRSEHHSFILSPGKTGGALLFRRALAAVGEAPSLRIAEAQSMVFASRQREAGVDVIAEKARVPVAALPNDEDPDWLGPAVDLFPAWQQVDNVLETSFENIGSVLHPILTLLNAAAVEHRDDGLMYHRTPPRIAAALEALDAERRAAALAYGIATHLLSEWISTAYPGGSGLSLVEQLDETMAYRSVALPDSLDSRFLTEDVPTGLVPLHAFGAAAGVHMPLTASVIHMCCAVLDRDFWREGRNLAALGQATCRRTKPASCGSPRLMATLRPGDRVGWSNPPWMPTPRHRPRSGCAGRSGPACRRGRRDGGRGLERPAQPRQCGAAEVLAAASPDHPSRRQFPAGSSQAAELVAHLRYSLQLAGYYGGPASQVRALYFAGLPAACDQVRASFGSEIPTFRGDESMGETLAILGVASELIPASMSCQSQYDDALMTFGEQVVASVPRTG